MYSALFCVVCMNERNDGDAVNMIYGRACLVKITRMSFEIS